MVNDSDAAVDRVADGRFAFYENAYFLEDAAVRRQLRLENGTDASVGDLKSRTNLHIMADCVINMPISIGLQKNSPIKARVDRFVRRVLEAGLITKWLDDAMQASANSKLKEKKSEVKAVVNMQKFFGAFVALFVGYLAAVVAFISELLYFHYYVRANPDYDKYSKTVQRKNK